MRSIFAILAFILTVILLAALLAPVVHPLLEGYSLDRTLRLVGRLLLIAGFFFMIRLLRVNDRRALGYGLPGAAFLRQLLLGLGLGLLTMAFLVGLLWWLGVRQFEANAWQQLISPQGAAALLSGLLAGLLIALWEESFFRGLIFTSIRRESGLLMGVLVSALLYAAMHFLVAPPPPTGQPIQWHSALPMIPVMLGNPFSPANLDSLVALFMAGVVLVLVRHYTGSLALAIGLHAGWVTIIKMTKYLMNTNPSSEWFWLVGRYDQISGWLGAVLFLLLLPQLLILKRLNHHKAPPAL
jgi:hypothetical protein